MVGLLHFSPGRTLTHVHLPHHTLPKLEMHAYLNTPKLCLAFCRFKGCLPDLTVFLNKGAKWDVYSTTMSWETGVTIKGFLLLALTIISCHCPGVYTLSYLFFFVSVRPKSLSLGKNEWPRTEKWCWINLNRPVCTKVNKYCMTVEFLFYSRQPSL